MAGKDVALANKESLVIAGELIMKEARKNTCSHHPGRFRTFCHLSMPCRGASIFVEKIISDSLRRPFPREEQRITSKMSPERSALKHPNWKMGEKITIDSASLMNKGLEVIEARWLFNVEPEQIEVVIHPQSVIHSMVQFIDGSMKAQMGLPDMKLPILYAMAYPVRISSDLPRFSFSDYPSLTFEAPDRELFRNLALAYHALERGGNMPCMLNAANEVAVQAFLEDEIRFLGCPQVIEQCMETAILYSRTGT